MPSKTIKIFLASSAELKADRDDFRVFISTVNDKLNAQDIYLKLVEWEYFLDAMSETRLQDEYNKAIAECQLMLCLFFTKVGSFTAEEFNTAYQLFKSTGKPRIWTYFKDAAINTGAISDEINTLIAFKKKLSDLGHFYTSYTGMDNLKYKFQSQLDEILPALAAPVETTAPKPAGTPVSTNGSAQAQATNTFNQVLTKKLMEAIQVYSPRAVKFLQSAAKIDTAWETQTRCSDPAKDIITFSFPGILGIQLRKLMAIGKEDFSTNKLYNYLLNCQLTAKRALQLLCFALVSRLWDDKKNNNYTLSPEQTLACTNFFENEFEVDIKGFTDLLTTLLSIFADNKLDLPVTELAGFKPNLQLSSSFMNACEKLQAISQLLDKNLFTQQDCFEAENQLATVLAAMNFWVNYKMVSIKNIGYYEMRNTKAHYLYNYTALGIDAKSNINQNRVNYADTPTNTDAVLLYKGSYQENLNLFPFVIDKNALAIEDGAKICFYASHNNTDGSLNYVFLEDNSTVNITNTQTLRPGIDINEVLADPEKFKDMRFDNLFTLFKEAKKTITGTDVDEDDTSSSPF